MKRNKYGAIKTTHNGLKFDSKLECERYKHLRLLEQAGEIRDLRRQDIFKLVVNGTLVCKLVVDHTYTDGSGKWVAEDAKGFLAAHSKIKLKLAAALYPDWEFRLWPERKAKPRKKSLKKRRV